MKIYWLNPITQNYAESTDENVIAAGTDDVAACGQLCTMVSDVIWSMWRLADEIAPLRLIQRDDNLANRPSPRIQQQTTRNSPTSLQQGVKRVGSRNTWW